MAINDILLPLASYSGIDQAAIEKCVAVIKRLDAHLTVLALDIDVRVPEVVFSTAFVLDVPVASESLEYRPTETNDKVLKAFETAAKAAKIPFRELVQHCAADEVTSAVIETARTKDICLFAVKHDGRQEALIEALLLESGRPILLFAEESCSALPNSFDRIAIAWDNSKEAAKAVADALPLLKKAKSVRIVTVTDERADGERRSGEELVTHLASHGIEAIFEMPQSSGTSVEKCLGNYIKEKKIDLFVMGAYRHSRLREFVIGGATYSMLGRPPCWVLMSH